MRSTWLPLLLLLSACNLPDPKKDVKGGSTTVDADQDGVAADDDCDDNDDKVFPGAVELCNGVDDDCDQATDEDALDAPTWFTDKDGDGWGIAGTGVRSCVTPNETAPRDGDCDDTKDTLTPKTTWYIDQDGDGYGAHFDTLEQCDKPEGYVLRDGDCDDLDLDVFPSRPETCDGRDNDCDGDRDDADDGVIAETWFYEDNDGDGFGSDTVKLRACVIPADYAAVAGDCNDNNNNVKPTAAENCLSNADDNCDGLTWARDAVQCTVYRMDGDTDGVGDADDTICTCPNDPTKGQYTALASAGDDCNDDNGSIFPGAPEFCGTTDEDCNAATGDESVLTENLTRWYADFDYDTFGDPDNLVVTQCADPMAVDPFTPVANNALDCDDGYSRVHPGLLEVCDGLDNDCDELTTESGLISGEEWNFPTVTEALEATGSAQICQAAVSEAIVLTKDRYYYIEGIGDPATPELGVTLTTPLSEGPVIRVDRGRLNLDYITVSGGHGLPDATEPSITRGGAIYAGDAYLSLYESKVTGGTATIGGGIYGGGTNRYTTLYYSEISGNTAAEDGGGVKGMGGVEIYESEILDNVAGGNGGGLDSEGYLYIGSGTSSISGNSAQNGGGMSMTAQSLSLQSLTLSDNSATANGGAVFVGHDEEMYINGGTLTANSAGGNGGAVYFAPASGKALTVQSGFYDGNDAGQGGAIYTSRLLTYDTQMTNNVAATSGGAVAALTFAGLFNGTFTSNTAATGDGGAAWIAAPFTSDALQLDASGSTFSANKANLGAGGAIRAGNVSVDVGAFTNNSATNGGALYVQRAYINDASFNTNNASAEGGAVYLIDDSLSASTTVSNTTFTGETCASSGVFSVGHGNLGISTTTFSSQEADCDSVHLRGLGYYSLTESPIYGSCYLDTAIPDGNCNLNYY